MATQFANGKIVTDGLVLCLDAADLNSYPTTGTTWFDLAGSNNGTLTNGPTFSGTGASSSIVFDGTNDYVGLPTLGNYGSNPISYEWVIKSIPNGNFQNIFYNSSDALSHIYIINNGNIRYYNGAISDTTNLSINTNIFKFITITRNGTSVLVYVNGVYQSNLTISTNIGNFNNPAIGVSNSQYPLNGSIALFKLYNKTLSSEEVLQNYNAQKARFGIS
jgi:hypothetical protein